MSIHVILNDMLEHVVAEELDSIIERPVVPLENIASLRKILLSRFLYAVGNFVSRLARNLNCLLDQWVGYFFFLSSFLVPYSFVFAVCY